ncbi:DAZ-associated protein 1 [Camelus dromedarius]|uniref:DAZ-associated protein 1 n=1 Tax=Camelus dromedarius TaxID=9838 RepID=A0A5N4CJI2_CAMDR|nr:DAZ-associated protein 1 [Camelus dromedarius]
MSVWVPLQVCAAASATVALRLRQQCSPVWLFQEALNLSPPGPLSDGPDGRHLGRTALVLNIFLLNCRKLFVGGLDWSTTQAETLRSYFSQYGEVVDCVIMKDKTTNQSRGFGFVKFKDPNCVGTVLASRPHTLDGRNQKGPRSDNSKSNKIFVGGIPHNCGETELREYFKKFGVVTEVVMIYDAEKQRPREQLGPGEPVQQAEDGTGQASQAVVLTQTSKLRLYCT